MSIALLPTTSWRRRGLVGHYLSWVLACTFAGTAIVLVLEHTLEAVEFGALMGFLGGLGLGVISRATGIGAVTPGSNDGDAGAAA